MDVDARGSRAQAVTTLREQAIGAVGWSAAAQVARQAIGLVTSFVLARLLAPEEFGLIGMAGAITAFATLFADLGTGAAVVRERELGAAQRSSFFWLNSLLGLALAALLVTAAPVAARFYAEPRVLWVLPALALPFVISGVAVIPQALMQRELRLVELARLEIVAAALAAIAGIAAALLGAGVWSLVLQSIVLAVVTTLLVWRQCHWRPQLLLQWAAVRPSMGFSLNLVGQRVVDYLHLNGDYLLIGHFLGATALGIYYLGYRLTAFVAQNVSAVLSRVLLAVFSRAQDDDEGLRRAYLESATAIALVTSPLLVGMMVVAGPAIRVLLGTKWESLVPVVTLLAPVGLSKALGSTVGVIYLAKGRSDLMFRWNLVVTAVVLTAFVVGLRWGVVGVAAAYAATLPLAVPSLTIPFCLIGLTLSSFWGAIRRPLVSSGLMAAVVLATRAAFDGRASDATILMLTCALGATTYALATWMLNRDAAVRLWSLVGGRR
jgi:O-antigen/teichoic acid export membrane protein